MKLTDTQLVLLSAAAQRQDGAIELGPKLKGSASRKVVGRLLSEGLIEEIPAQGSCRSGGAAKIRERLRCASPSPASPRSAPARVPRRAPSRPAGRTEEPKAKLAGLRAGPRPPASGPARLRAGPPRRAVPNRSRRR